MKLKTALTLLSFVFTFSAVFGQSLKTWNWDTYKMSFKAPTDFKVSENNAKTFDAGNEAIHLTIYPEKGDEMLQSEMKTSLNTWARDNKLKFEGGIQKMEDLNGYWGVYVDGVANELPTTILLLVDPDYPTIKFYVWLQYTEAAFDTAVKILKSFIPS